MSHAILYISYDGILEPLRQSQVLGYLAHLAPNQRIVLISFEKTEDWLRIEFWELLRSNMLSYSCEHQLQWIRWQQGALHISNIFISQAARENWLHAIEFTELGA